MKDFTFFEIAVKSGILCIQMKINGNKRKTTRNKEDERNEIKEKSQSRQEGK